MTIIIVALFTIVVICFIWANNLNKDKNHIHEAKEIMESVGIDVGDSEPYEGNEKMMWVAVPGHEICSDCLQRAGEIKTLNEWEKLGLPGEGKTECGTDCYCILDDDLSRELSPRIIMEKNQLKR